MFLCDYSDTVEFKLGDKFLSTYKNKQVNWKYGALGYITYKRTYARKLGNRTEEWWETCRRVVEGTFTVQRTHCQQIGLPWNARKAARSAQEMFKRMYSFKWLPPGRGLWAMGIPFMFERSGACLNNCAFVSTKQIDQDFAAPFVWAFDLEMLGVGVGYDTRGAGKVTIVKPDYPPDVRIHTVPDSREGWVHVARRILNAYIGIGTLPTIFNYSQIRPKGSEIKSFGGLAPGPEPLQKFVTSALALCEEYVGSQVDSTFIVDMMNLIGRCVVSGGIRRTALIALGDKHDEEFLNLKEDKEKVMEYRWASNNSVFCDVGMDYTSYAQRTANNGEPGYLWLNNAREYGRMKDPPDYKDQWAMGVNPCVTGDTLVPSSDGLQPIKNLFEKQPSQIVTDDLNYYDRIAYRGNKPTISVLFSDGRILQCTPDHRVKTDVGWVEAQHLQSSHAVEIANYYLQRGIPGDENLAEILGYFVGDGHVSGNCITLSFYGDKRHMVEYYEQLTGKKGRIYPDRNEIQIFTGIKHTGEKHAVPDWVLSGDEHVRKSFLRGLFSADGSCQGDVSKGRSIRLGSVSENLLRDVQQLLLSLNVNSTIYYYRKEAGVRSLPDGKGGKKDYSCQANHELVISRDNIVRYASIGFSNQSPQNERLANLLEMGTRSFYQDRFITHPVWMWDSGPADVYDVVGSEDSTFVANGITVHNCSEQVLWDMELCCLVETYPAHHDTMEDYHLTLKYAYLYAKTVTLVPTHLPKTNAVVLRNRRIGCSVSGLFQAFQRNGYRKTFEWLDSGYEEIQRLDKIYSDWLCVPKSIKTTSVKPSGTVSILAGATPGMHAAHAPYYIRRVRVQDSSTLVDMCRKAGYHVEPDQYADQTVVIEFPIKEPNYYCSKFDLTLQEQMEINANLQYYWSDNAVSCTATFKAEEAEKLPRLLEMYESRLKSISFLPLTNHNYPQAPYESITQARYEELIANLKPIRGQIDHEAEDKFCDGEACSL